MKNLIIHHRADSDGLMSEAIIRKHLESLVDTESVTSIGMDYGDDVPELPKFDIAYMLDFTCDELLSHEWFRKKCVLIDHHKTALEKWGPLSKSFREFHVTLGVAACRLCAAWVQNRLPWLVEWDEEMQDWETSELILIGLRDVWRHVGTVFEADATHLELGLRAEWPPDFRAILDAGRSFWQVGNLIHNGSVISSYQQAQSREHAQRGAHILHFHDKKFVALNTQARGSLALDQHSRELMEAGVQHDALLVWSVGSDGVTVHVSMYHADHNKDIDLSEIAKAHGGGGHPGACGFRKDLLEWIQVYDASNYVTQQDGDA